jgi:hypothetical protein
MEKNKKETLSEQRERILKNLFPPEWFIKRELFFKQHNKKDKQLNLFQ